MYVMLIDHSCFLILKLTNTAQLYVNCIARLGWACVKYTVCLQQRGCVLVDCNSLGGFCLVWFGGLNLVEFGGGILRRLNVQLNLGWWAVGIVMH